MKWYTGNIEELTINNNDFRHVLYTWHNAQLVLMSLNPGEEIGMEVHSENDQFFRFEQGEGKCVIDWNEYSVSDGSAVIVPAWAKHNIINTSKEVQLKMYTIYSPPHHKDGIIRKTKQEAETNEEDFDWVITE